MKTYMLTRRLSLSLTGCGLMASHALFGNATIVEDFESFDFGSQSANNNGSFTIVNGISPGSTRAAEIVSPFRHVFNWTGDGQTVATFSFDFFNSPTGNSFTDARVAFALNQNTSNILSGANNLIRMVADTQSDESTGFFAFQQSTGASFVDSGYPMDTLVTVHFVLNNTSEPETNEHGVTVAANSVQLWREIGGIQSFAGSANITADRLDSDLVMIGIGAFSTYDRSGGFVVDNIRFEDGIAVIPEPSTYAALAGLLAVGLVMVRRRIFRKG